MYPTTHPQPVDASVKRYASGLAHVELVLDENDVTDCQRCSRCASKIKVADAELGHLRCNHRMPSCDVPSFLFGPTVPDRDNAADVESASSEPEWPTEASMAVVDFFGRKALLFAWSDAAWSMEPYKPAAWSVRDGHLWIVPDPAESPSPIKVSPWAGRADRFCVAPALDIEVSLSGLLAVYTVTPRLDDDATPSSQGVPLAGEGGVPWADITHRADLFKSLNGYPA
jgi:hypothetical protein